MRAWRRSQEPLIDRDEAVALLFSVHNINETLLRIEQLLQEADDDAKEDD
jgi:hypothetical protein